MTNLFIFRSGMAELIDAELHPRAVDGQVVRVAEQIGDGLVFITTPDGSEPLGMSHVVSLRPLPVNKRKFLFDPFTGHTKESKLKLS